MAAMNRMLATSRLLFLIALLSAAGIAAAYAKSPAASLRAQLSELAAKQGFVIGGLERIGTEGAIKANGALPRQLRRMLKRYNYMLFLKPGGGVTEVQIVGARSRTRGKSRRHAVRTIRRGSHHLVRATLVGPNATRRNVRLMIDTGATTIVLPSSMIATLGFRSGALTDGWSQTANGKVKVKMGTLRSIKVGDAEAKNLRVTFIADDRAGKTKLLGMNFLKSFRFSIDDKKNQLILLLQ